MKNFLEKFRQFSNEQKSNDQKKVLVIDGTNTFIRSISVNTSTNDDGLHVGGLVGFLRSIGSATRLIQPDECIIVFDGKNGSKARKTIYPEYKSNRTKNKPINNIFASIAEQEQAFTFQMSRISTYLRTLPVKVIVANNMEADDAIAYIVNYYSGYHNWEKYIMSTDKDFFQLVSDNIKIYSPTKKIIYDKQTILNEYEISPKNFILYKILEGDGSDGVPGVKGLGLKTMKKYFPFITEDKEHNYDELISHAKQNINESKVYKTISNSEDILERNYKLMKLPFEISDNQRSILENSISQPSYQLVKHKFISYMVEDKINAHFKNVQSWFDNSWMQLNFKTNK